MCVSEMRIPADENEGASSMLQVCVFRRMQLWV